MGAVATFVSTGTVGGVVVDGGVVVVDDEGGVVTGGEGNVGVITGSEGDVRVVARKIHFKMCENCRFWEKNSLMEQKYRLVFKGISCREPCIIDFLVYSKCNCKV